MRNTYYDEQHYYMCMGHEQQIRRSARVREVRREKLFLIIGVLITMALCSFFSVKAFANTDNTRVDSFGTKQYRSIVIYCGDTVESIAEDNYSFQFSSVDKMAREIRSINHLSSDEVLVPGNYIVIPYFRSSSGY